MHEDDWVVDGLVELWRLMEIVGKLELDGVSIGEEPHWPSGLRTPRLQRWCRTAHTCTGREAECHALRIRRTAAVYILYQLSSKQNKQSSLGSTHVVPLHTKGKRGNIIMLRIVSVKSPNATLPFPTAYSYYHTKML